MSIVRTRIAPSPTGDDIHIGTIATALVNYAWAKKHKGEFIVRIEDTDRTRYVKGSEKKMLSTLDRVGLIADESPIKSGKFGPYRQSERLEIYKKYALQLIENKSAYYCTCSKERLATLRAEQQQKKQITKYDKFCFYHQEDVISQIKNGGSYVIRLNITGNQEIEFDDIIRGRVKFNTDALDDQVLLKSDGYPTYHLAVVIDDYLMKINYVIRAEEWLSSTPKHILLYRAFNWPLPQFAHVSLLRNPDRSKLSKRKNPVWASWYLENGILPEALLNYLALMGWSHSEGKEIFSLDEYIDKFDLKDMQKTAPVFDQVKLEWMCGEYIRQTQNSKLKSQIWEFYDKNHNQELIGKTIPLIKERIKKLSDYMPLCQFFFEPPENYDIDLGKYKQLISIINNQLSMINDDDWKADTIGGKMQELAKKENIKPAEFFMVLRVAITGRKISPPLNESMEILGRKECLNRLQLVINSYN